MLATMAVRAVLIFCVLAVGLPTLALGLILIGTFFGVLWDGVQRCEPGDCLTYVVFAATIGISFLILVFQEWRKRVRH